MFLTQLEIIGKQTNKQTKQGKLLKFSLVAECACCYSAALTIVLFPPTAVSSSRPVLCCLGALWHCLWWLSSLVDVWLLICHVSLWQANSILFLLICTEKQSSGGKKWPRMEAKTLKRTFCMCSKQSPRTPHTAQAGIELRTLCIAVESCISP